MKIYYINLDRRADRNQRFLRFNSRIAKFQRISAVELNSDMIPDLIEQNIIDPSLDTYSLGALGATLSHSKVWNMAATTGAVMTVAEDDAVFNNSFVEKSKTVIRSLPKNWDLILWGWNFDSLLHLQMLEDIADTVTMFNPALPDEALMDFQRKNFISAPLRLLGAFGMVCYSISPQGAIKLKQNFFPLRKEMVWIPGLNRNLINFSPDVILNKWYPYINAYACFPPLVLTPNDKSQSDNFPTT